MNIQECCVDAWSQMKMPVRIQFLHQLGCPHAKKIARLGFDRIPSTVRGRLILAVTEENGRFYFRMNELWRAMAIVRKAVAAFRK